eukprot:TRINITY_DN2832_c2_g1_i1.p1 TRINITY_DN2832_c2_g1~~TRINITY_DN2832_c2_g1_i1.p1  ORF type:complete len:362 (+),score=177.56 TRINITY_DN2832_c2_g1_i1:87-1088(+)
MQVHGGNAYYSERCRNCMEYAVEECGGFLTCTSCGLASDRKIDWRDDITHQDEESNSRASTLNDNGRLFRNVLEVSRVLNIPEVFGYASASMLAESFPEGLGQEDTKRFKSICAAAFYASGAKCDIGMMGKTLKIEPSSIRKKALKIKSTFLTPRGVDQKALFQEALASISVLSSPSPPPVVVHEVESPEINDVDAEVTEMSVSSPSSVEVLAPVQQISASVEETLADKSKWNEIDDDVRSKINLITKSFPAGFNQIAFAQKVIEVARKNDYILMSRRPVTRTFASIVECWNSPDGPNTPVPWEAFRPHKGVKKTICAALKELEVHRSSRPSF